MKFPLLVFITSITVGGAIFFMNGNASVVKNEVEYKIQKVEVSMEEENIETNTDIEEKVSNISENELALMNSLYEENNDFVGILMGNDIEFPVYMSSKDEPYKYLKVDSENKKSVSGEIFMDVLSNDNKKILWGHHMKNGMFKFVDKMATNEETFNKYQNLVYIDYNNGEPVKYNLNAKYALTGKDGNNSHPTNDNFMKNKNITQKELTNISNEFILGTCNYDYNTDAHSFVVFEANIQE